MTTRTKIGFVGCGNVSNPYFKVAQSFDNLEVAACADADMERAKTQADKYGLPRACTVHALLAEPEIEIVVNLTPPEALAQISLVAFNFVGPYDADWEVICASVVITIIPALILFLFLQKYIYNGLIQGAVKY
jgi:predicted dinucleotide-utilizing enzyme